MARNNIFSKWIFALIIITVIIFIWKYKRIPDKEDNLSEQIEEIDWEEIDKIEFIADNAIQLIRTTQGFELLKNDTSYQVDNDKINELFKTLEQLQNAEQQILNFSDWSRNKNDSTGLTIKLYENTEEVLNVYTYTDEQFSYIRYFDDSIIYRTANITKVQFQWLDTLSSY